MLIVQVLNFKPSTATYAVKEASLSLHFKKKEAFLLTEQVHGQSWQHSSQQSFTGLKVLCTADEGVTIQPGADSGGFWVGQR